MNWTSLTCSLEFEPLRRNALQPNRNFVHLIRKEQNPHQNHQDAAYLHQRAGIFQDPAGRADKECQDEKWNGKS